MVEATLPAEGGMGVQARRSMQFFGSANQQPSLRFSRLIAWVLMLGVVSVVLAIILSAIWMARQHDELAGSSAERMVRGGITAFEEKLQTISMDFAIWPAAVDALAAGDVGWVWENYGISVVDTKTTDLMILAPADGTTPYGWTQDMGEEPETGILPREVVSSALSMLDEIPILERRAAAAYYHVDGEIWLLTTARIVSNIEADVPRDDSQIPRLLFGFKVTDELMGEIGRSFLIDDLSIAEPTAAREGKIELNSRSGAPIAAAVWTPPRPGEEILRQILLPLGIGLALLIVISLLTSNLVVRSARRLERALVAANAANRAKTEFLANVSHELRTPMNGIIGIGSLLQRSELDNQQQDMMQMLMASADTQMRLISDLLDITQIESGQTQLNLAPFDIVDVVKGVCSVLQLQADQKSLQLVLHLPDEPALHVFGDRGRYQQIVTNLVSNAVKFTDEGQVDVTLAAERRMGEIRTRLEVTDTGPGIAPRDQERIFERFFQVDSSMTRKNSGTGLGLSITKSLVEIMQGRFGLVSAPGKGSTFRVEIDFDPVSTSKVQSEPV